MLCLASDLACSLVLFAMDDNENVHFTAREERLPCPLYILKVVFLRLFEHIVLYFGQASIIFCIWREHSLILLFMHLI